MKDKNIFNCSEVQIKQSKSQCSKNSNVKLRETDQRLIKANNNIDMVEICCTVTANSVKCKLHSLLFALTVVFTPTEFEIYSSCSVKLKQ